MTTLAHMDEREEAWGRLHEALPARWTVARGSYNPGERRWSMRSSSETVREFASSSGVEAHSRFRHRRHRRALTAVP